MNMLRAAGRLALRLIATPRQEATVTGDQPFDHSHDDDDYDPAHPDAQHEQPPVESTDDPADDTATAGAADADDPDAGDLPGDIPQTDEDWPPGEGGET